jgi:hypothetical protein
LHVIDVMERVVQRVFEKSADCASVVADRDASLPRGRARVNRHVSKAANLHIKLIDNRVPTLVAVTRRARLTFRAGASTPFSCSAKAVARGDAT